MPFFILLFFSLFIAVGCGPKFGPGASSSNSSSGDGSAQGLPGGDPGTPPGGGVGSGDLGICGPLPFDNVVWPIDLTFAGRRAFATSLNITGSFEGDRLWSTIADNSDGQGVSLGLLQQNLGQGTLQPLLIRIRDENPKLLTQLFTAADRTSLLQMLSAWEGTIGPTSIEGDQNSEHELFPDREVLSRLDGTSVFFEPRLITRNSASVEWAKKTLYLNRNFILRWKKSLTDLANSAPYRSLQIEKARNLFDLSEDYFSAFKFHEQRFFFLMFDFVVQNGGFNLSQKRMYDAFVKANPTASETLRAKKLLELRLTGVLTRYRADVRARKTTIIDSVGTVHGQRRNLPKENCYVPNEVLTSVGQ